MTTSDVMTALRRRWYVVLLGLLATAFVAALALSAQGVFLSERSVRFVAPAGTDNNSLVHSSYSLISMAGLVERTVNQPTGLPPTASIDITLPDRGIREGSAVLLPNDGGQWSYQFNRPELLVEAAGASPDQVVVQMTRATARIRETLDQIQAGIPADNRIEARVVVPTSAVTYAHGRRKPALLATVLLGTGLTVALTVVLDRALVRRRRRNGGHGRRAAA